MKNLTLCSQWRMQRKKSEEGILSWDLCKGLYLALLLIVQQAEWNFSVSDASACCRESKSK